METKSGTKYERLRKIGIGSYGVVFKCVNRQTGQVVAIKRYSENDSDPIIRKIAMREVRMLRQLKHPNLINLIEVFRRKRRLHLVFDYCELTVLDVIEKYTSSCPLNLIRKIIWQTVNGINYCHTHNPTNSRSIAKQCIHRDIKPENILINQSGVVKLCDFGFARSIKSSTSPASAAVVPSPERSLFQARDSRTLGDQLGGGGGGGGGRTAEATASRDDTNYSSSDRQAFTEYVATRWYRAPELLIGEIYYDIKIDIWAIGCVTAELMRGEPIWPGKTDLDQLYTIKSSLGLLTSSQTHTLLSQGIYDQPNMERLLGQPASPSDSIEKKLPARIGQSGLDFVSACLQMDPARRPTSHELLQHEYIYSARMAQFIQKDHAPTHRLPALLGDRTVTLPSLSPTMNRTNSQALILLTSSKHQHQQQQQRPTKKFVDTSCESPNRKAAPPSGYDNNQKTSSIPLAVSMQQRSSNISLQRSPMKQVGKSNNIKKPATTSITATLNATTGVATAAAADVGKYGKRKPVVKSTVNGSQGFATAKPIGASISTTGPKQQMDTAPGGNSKSLLPVAKIRTKETSQQQRQQLQQQQPKRRTSSPETNHQRDYDRSTMTNAAASPSIGVPVQNNNSNNSNDSNDSNNNNNNKTRLTRRILGPQTKRLVQQSRNSASTDRHGSLALNGADEERQQVTDQGKENYAVKTNKRKTAANDSSASSSNYSDSLGTVRSSSISYLPPVYQDKRS